MKVQKYLLINLLLLMSSHVFGESWTILVTNLDQQPVTCVGLIPTGPFVTKPIAKANIIQPNAIWPLTISVACSQCMSPPGTILCQDFVTGQYKELMLFPNCHVNWHHNAFSDLQCPTTGL